MVVDYDGLGGGGGGGGSVLLYIVKQDLEMFTESLFALQYLNVVLMELWIRCMEVEKLKMLSANCIDGNGRSWSTGESQLDLKAKMMSSMNKLNSSVDSGSPCLRPMDVSKGCPLFGS